MNAFGLSFHHLGLASRNEEQSANFLAGMGYCIGQRIFDPLQKVHLRLCCSESMPDVEIVTPTDASGPLDSILKQNEYNLYHTCYVTKDLRYSLEQFKQYGIRLLCVSAPKPAILFDNKLVSFYFAKGFGLIELLEF
jgi:methylmalonyl-CoA/ethylmalonyl-CoA epimerase